MIYGASGNDTLLGGNDVDVPDRWGGRGFSRWRGGNDTADYSASSSAVTVNLTSGTGTGGDAQGDTLSAIENIVGSAQADTLDRRRQCQ